MSKSQSSTEELFKQFLEQQAQGEKRKKKNIKKLIHELATEGRKFYYDQNNNTYVEVFDTRSENPQATYLIPIESSQYDRWLIREFNAKYDEYLDNNNFLKTIKILVSEEAKDSGRLIEIHNRIAMENDAIFIDIGCRNRKVIRVDKNGWDVGYYKVFFKRHKDMAELPVPKRGGNIFEIIPFMPPLPKRDRCLALSWLIASFFSNIERVFLLVEGEKGSGKTTLAKLLKSLIDPTNKGALAYKDNAAMMAQNIDHHCIPLIDNVTKISQSVSDLFCAAYSSGGDTKRKQYTDDEDFIFTLTGNVIFTTVRLKSPKSDFLDRCYKIETAKTENTYRSKQQFENKFESIKGKLFGAVLDVVSKTMSEVEKSDPATDFRTVDFDHYGSCASEVMGYGKELFSEARKHSESIKNTSITNATPIILALNDYLKNNGYHYLGPIGKLLQELPMDLQASGDIPNTPKVFARRINELRPELKAAGIAATRHPNDRNGSRWEFILRNDYQEDNFEQESEILPSQPQLPINDSAVHQQPSLGENNTEVIEPALDENPFLVSEDEIQSSSKGTFTGQINEPCNDFDEILGFKK